MGDLSLTGSSKRYVASLDGLRAFAVLSVIAYHMGAAWAPGGLLGVTVFFVLSGYLITGLLLRERATTKTISLSGFWLRRVRRIIPAVVFAILGTAVLCTIFNHALLTKMRPDVVPTLFFFNNWWQIFHNVSYFEALSQPSPLTHFWSLSIEEQFYLVWPVLLLVCTKLGMQKKTMRRATLVLAILSVVEMMLLYDPTQDPSRVYYGTDTRASALLFGSYLAFVWPYQRLRARGKRAPGPGVLPVLNIVGIGAFAALLAMVALVGGTDEFTYRGGIAICSVLAALLIAALAHPSTLVTRFFQLPPLVWIGKISYSMYLWHYPIILIMAPNGRVADCPWWLCIIELAVIFGISAFSYYVVENPIRHGALGAFFSDLRSRAFTLGDWLRGHMAVCAAGVAVVCVAIGGLAFVPDTAPPVDMAALGAQQGQVQDQGQDQQKHQGQQSQAAQKYPGVAPYDILLIGDSVSAQLTYLGAFPIMFPYGHNDSEISRELSEAADVYRSYEEEGAVGDIVVIALGANGPVNATLLDDLMDAIGTDKHVWFVNAYNPYDQTLKQSNSAIKACTERHKNAELLDWNSIASELAPSDFMEDGIHPSQSGVYAYCDMISRAISPYLPKHKANEKTRDELIAELDSEDSPASGQTAESEPPDSSTQPNSSQADGASGQTGGASS